MLLETGQKLADAIIVRLKPYCSRIEVAGSIRRKKRQVNDIDIVLITTDPWGLEAEIRKIRAASGAKTKPRADGAKIKTLHIQGQPVDLYIATEETWVTLLLIRTGSVEHNRRLCSIAKSMGWSLHADGSGLFDENNQRIAGDTEESIFKALGVSYKKPEER